MATGASTLPPLAVYGSMTDGPFGAVSITPDDIVAVPARSAVVG